MRFIVQHGALAALIVFCIAVAIPIVPTGWLIGLGDMTRADDSGGPRPLPAGTRFEWTAKYSDPPRGATGTIIGSAGNAKCPNGWSHVEFDYWPARPGREWCAWPSDVKEIR